MPDRYTAEAARAAGPDPFDPDDMDVDLLLERIATLEKLARDLYRVARGGSAPDRLPGVRIVRSDLPQGSLDNVRAGLPTFDAFIGEPHPEGLHHGEHVACRSTEADAIAKTWEHARDWIKLEQWAALHGSRLTPELERRACDLLDLDPPGFDPTTEGP